MLLKVRFSLLRLFSFLEIRGLDTSLSKTELTDFLDLVRLLVKLLMGAKKHRTR